MEQLSSCYFCGGALDASLDEHPVVPGSLHPSADDQKTVVLCGTCKRKLDAVMEAVVGAIDESASVDASAGETARGEGDSGSESISDIESTLGDDEDVLRSVGGDSNGDGTADETTVDGDESDGDSRDDEKERKYTSSRRAGYTGEDRSDRGDHRGSDDHGDGRRESGGSADRGDGSTTEDGGDGSSTEDGNDEDVPDVTLTRLENTKVMRLLQNRDFPVEREDFVTVASSAYEVSPGDCDKVIDLAIEHDLLREESGQLYAGARWD